MVSSTSLTNYDLKPANFNGKISSASAVNAISPTNIPSISTLKRNSFNSNTSTTKQTTNGLTFTASLTSNGSDFYFRTLLRYTRSGNADNFAEKLDFILKQCPYYTTPTKSNTLSTNLSLSPNLNHSHTSSHHHKEHKEHKEHILMSI